MSTDKRYFMIPRTKKGVLSRFRRWRYYKTVRTKKEVDDLLERCNEAQAEESTAFSGMTYEQGILYGISWLIEEDDADPITEQ